MLKIKILKPFIFLLLISTTGAINAQQDSILTFKMKEFDLTCSYKFQNIDIRGNSIRGNSITFLNDSLVRVSNKTGAFNDLNLDSIYEISFKTGKNRMWAGMFFGAANGILEGIFMGFIVKLVSGSDRGYTILPISFGILGGILGGIGGAKTPAYDNYYLESEKKDRLLEIANKYKRRNSK